MQLVDKQQIKKMLQKKDIVGHSGEMVN